MPLPASTDVLVVGAGPTGLALANALAAQDVSSLVIDRQPTGANTSRAAVIHARTLEVLEPLGVVPDLLAHGLKTTVFRLHDGDRVLLTLDFRHLPSRYAYALVCPQSDTEAVLAAGLQAHGQTICRRCELIGAHPGTDGVIATLRDPDREHTIRARYVVGCDGMHSAVRTLAAIPFHGDSYQEIFVLADVRMDWPLPRDAVSLFLAAAGLLLVAPLPDDRFRIVATVSNASEIPSMTEVQALLDARGPRSAPARVRDIVWASRFHVHHRLARTFHQGPFLLAGDAAHVHSPAGGQGMNIGIHDAVALGPALAAALRTNNDQALAEWAQQRHRIAAEVVRMTDRMTRAATIGSRPGQALRNTVIQVAGHIPAVRQAIAMRLSELSGRTA
jgi:2-polyprenyl-6-methoxyphenol hydroxylase-like FAD-dependent oxidoreductase